MLGRWDEALATIDEVTEDQVRSGGVMLSVLQAGVEGHCLRGELETARRISEMYSYLENSSDMQDQGCVRSTTATLLRAKGRLEEALAAGASTIEVAAAMGATFQGIKHGVVDAIDVALELGETAKADELLAWVDELPPGERAPWFRAQSLRFRARIAGDAAGLGEAAARFRALNLPFWTAVVQLEQAEALGPQRRGGASPRRGARDLRAARSRSVARAGRRRGRNECGRMTCPNCGTENRAGAKFCVRCGEGLALACPACGSGFQPGDVFCAECGASLTTPSASAAVPSAPAAERKLVSVLFADLVGFTALSEERDSEDTRELLSRYFDTCRRLIELYGGTVEKFIGDAVMAVWGTPSATEDDAERAVRAALDLVAAVSALGDEVGVPDLRRAPACSPARPRSRSAPRARAWSPATSSTPPRGSSPLAEPGTVLVGDATRRATEQRSPTRTQAATS